VKTIRISDIVVAPNRQRKVFDAAKLAEFAGGIKARGLLHPVVLREVDDKFILVAGERRLRACTDIHDLQGDLYHDGQLVPSGFIPYTLLGDLDPLAAEEAELEENIHREDLTWQERTAAHSRLAQLRTAQALAKGVPAPTVTDLSTEIRGSADGIHRETTRRELIVAKHLDKPEVAAAKNVDDAFKVLKKIEAAEVNRALGAAVGRTFSAEMHQLFHGDSLVWLANTCDANQFDVILTDPPYGMSADEFGDSGGLAAGAHGYEDSKENFLAIMDVLPGQLFRVAKEQAHLYLFCDIDWFGELKTRFAAAGWQVFRTPLIWHKPSGMRAPWPEQGPQRKYETILYAVKGKRTVTKMAPDLIAYPPDTNLGHAAQKPVALYDDLLRRSVRPGDSILDPFCGSGPIFPAAHALKCRAVGVEMDQGSYGIAVKRIEQLKAQQELGL